DSHLLFDMALKGANDISRAQDPRVVLEMLILRMVAAPRIESLKAHFSTRSNQSVGPKSMSIERPQAKAASVESATSSTPGSLEERWAQFVEKVKKVNGLVATKLEHTFPISLEGKTLNIGVPAKMK